MISPAGRWTEGLRYIAAMYVLLGSLLFSQEKNVLSQFDIANASPKILKLSEDLKEISGIVNTGDDKYFVHNDEYAKIFQIDIMSGRVIKSFFLGSTPMIGDFEDIAYTGGKFYLLSSKGHIYVFREGRDKESVQYEKIKLPLSSEADNEGLCYDSEKNSLLVACKDFPGEGYKGYRTIYSYSLDKNTMYKKPVFTLKISKICKSLGIDKFMPSAITYQRTSGHFFVISAHDNSIIELNRSGDILAMEKLPADIHYQPEGICFSRSGDLIITNEGKKRGTIVIYSRPKK